MNKIAAFRSVRHKPTTCEQKTRPICLWDNRVEANKRYAFIVVTDVGKRIELVPEKFENKPHEIQRMIYHVALDLERIHDAGFIHRDVKPENVVYSSECDKYNLIGYSNALDKTYGGAAFGKTTSCPLLHSKIILTKLEADACPLLRPFVFVHVGLWGLQFRVNVGLCFAQGVTVKNKCTNSEFHTKSNHHPSKIGPKSMKIWSRDVLRPFWAAGGAQDGSREAPGESSAPNKCFLFENVAPRFVGWTPGKSKGGPTIVILSIDRRFWRQKNALWEGFIL